MTTAAANVYDLAYPSPISLEKISAIVVVVELWREEICAHLESKRLHEMGSKKKIQLNNMVPDLPSEIVNLLERYADIFRESMAQWLFFQRNFVFSPYYGDQFDILSRFHDFAWDWDGSIHDVRTAKRMMMCERLETDLKFKIACFYCFEEDIKRIWPSVSADEVDLTLRENDFDSLTVRYYWIYYLRDELHKVPNPSNHSIDEVILRQCISISVRQGLSISINLSNVMYFWDRLSPNRQLGIAIDKFSQWGVLFSRFILQKLNEEQLDAFLAAKSGELMKFSLKYGPEPLRGFGAWMYIRNKINADTFIRFIYQVLRSEMDIRYLFSWFESWDNAWYHVFREIWDNTPQRLKRAVLDLELFSYPTFLSENASPSRPRPKPMKFLITVLQDATFEERSVLWHKNWQNLMYGAPVEDLRELMKLCFQNENEIRLFKENVMSVYENIAKWCVSLLRRNSFNDLNDFLSFCCINEQKRRELKRLSLWSNYFGESSELTMTMTVVRNNKLLNEFIDDAFQDATDLVVEFKNQLTSSLVFATQRWSFTSMDIDQFVLLMEFVDTFCSEEQVVAPVKKCLIEIFSKCLIEWGIERMDKNKAQRFLIWLLGSEDEVFRFKQSISIDDVFRSTMKTERIRIGTRNNDHSTNKFPEMLDEFLRWYFNGDEEEVEEFKKRFPDEV